jgi:hypothetical protein
LLPLQTCCILYQIAEEGEWRAAEVDVGGVEGGKCNFLEKSICN